MHLLQLCGVLLHRNKLHLHKWKKKKKCCFYYLLVILYSFTHNLFRRKKKSYTSAIYISVSVNLSSALRFKSISCKSIRKSPLKSSSYHRCLYICVCTHSTALQPMQTLTAFPFLQKTTDHNMK